MLLFELLIQVVLDLTWVYLQLLKEKIELLLRLTTELHVQKIISVEATFPIQGLGAVQVQYYST